MATSENTPVVWLNLISTPVFSLLVTAVLRDWKVASVGMVMVSPPICMFAGKVPSKNASIRALSITFTPVRGCAFACEFSMFIMSIDVEPILKRTRNALESKSSGSEAVMAGISRTFGSVLRIEIEPFALKSTVKPAAAA